MAYQIFISYRRDGGEALAYILNEKLSAVGHQVFYDMESLTGGKFNEKLFDVIDVCQDVIVVLSSSALDRCENPDDWVRQEIAYAIAKKKNLIPVMTEDFEWPNNMSDDISELKNYNGVLVNYAFFEGVIERIEKNMRYNKSIQNSETDGTSDLRHVLVWSDFEHGTLAKMFKKLRLDESYYIEELNEPVELLSKNLREVFAIILFDTDVTKLSNNSIAIERINNALIDYVEHGGRLIATHDIIYRRTRNYGLQEMFGCKVNQFQQMSSVKYVKTPLCEEYELFQDLPNEFYLHDDEICWGDLAPDIDVYFETEEGQALVFSREYGDGICFWLNSGDFKDYPSRSILKPEKELIEIIKTTMLMSY